MADNFSDLRGLFRRQYAKKVAVGINYQAPFSSFIESGDGPEKSKWVGDDLYFPIHVSGGVGQGYRARGGHMPSPGNQVVVQAKVNRSLFYATARIDLPTVEQANSPGGYRELLKFVTDAILKETKVRHGWQYWTQPLNDATNAPDLNGIICGVRTTGATSNLTLAGETVYALPVKGYLGWRRPDRETFLSRGNDAVALFNDNPSIVIGTLANLRAGAGVIRRVKGRSADGLTVYIDQAYTATAATWTVNTGLVPSTAGDFIAYGDSLVPGDNDYRTSLNGLGMFMFHGTDAAEYQGQKVSTPVNYAYCPNLQSMNANSNSTDATAFDIERTNILVASHFGSQPGLGDPKSTRIFSHHTVGSAFRDVLADQVRLEPLELKGGFNAYSYSWGGKKFEWVDDDRFCPRGYMFFIDKSSMMLAINKEGDFEDFNGNIWSKLIDTDAASCRWKKYHQLAVTEPAKNLAIGNIPVNQAIP